MKKFVEKLIERLEEQKSELTTWAEDKAFEIGIETAVSIVKQLAEEFATDKNVGHNDQDLCEWKLDGVYLICQHSTELYISCLEEEKYRYNYCPVCGKKIKVVE